MLLEFEMMRVEIKPELLRWACERAGFAADRNPQSGRFRAIFLRNATLRRINDYRRDAE